MRRRFKLVSFQLVCWVVASMLAAVHPARAGYGPSAAVEMVIMVNGSVMLEGERFTNIHELELKLLEVSHRQPEPDLIVRWERGNDARNGFRRLAVAILLIRDMGLKRDLPAIEAITNPGLGH